jgi:hypothetical protein
MDSLKFVNTLDCKNLDRSTLPLPVLLPHFRVHAGDGESSSNLFLLEDENPKFLEITGLGNVKSAEEAQEIKLVEKRRIERLELEWSRSRDDKRFMEDDEVLKELLPPDTVKNFKLRGYRSINFPSWVMGIATYLPNLTAIILWALPNCINLPPLGQLPELEHLTIGKMDSIRKIGGDLYGGIRAFPTLNELCLEDMVCLEDWNMPYSSSEDSLNEHMLPSLHMLSIGHCPRLRLKPWLAAGGNDYYLSIRGNDGVILSSWEGGGHVRVKCTRLCVECCVAPLYQWSLLCHLPCLKRLRIMRCQDLTCSSPDVLGGLSSLQKLVVSRCGRITSLPDCLGDLTSLEELRIHKCRRIKALPDSIQQLTNLQRIVISSCPDLELWCQSEENKMKLAHIKELVCALPIHPL